MEEDKLYCPHCGSSQLVTNRKGFRAGKAATGALLTGGIGLLAGFMGSDELKVICLKCGAEWHPGELRTTPLSKEEIDKNKKHDSCLGRIAMLLLLIMFIISIIIIHRCSQLF